MTRIGIVRLLYGRLVERRPHSRFTSAPCETAANTAWAARALAWGETHVDALGHFQEAA